MALVVQEGTLQPGPLKYTIHQGTPRAVSISEDTKRRLEQCLKRYQCQGKRGAYWLLGEVISDLSPEESLDEAQVIAFLNRVASGQRKLAPPSQF